MGLLTYPDRQAGIYAGARSELYCFSSEPDSAAARSDGVDATTIGRLDCLAA